MFYLQLIDNKFYYQLPPKVQGLIAQTQATWAGFCELPVT